MYLFCPQINKVRRSEASSDKAWRTVQINADSSIDVIGIHFKEIEILIRL
jgi:hypothetical protein